VESMPKVHIAKRVAVKPDRRIRGVIFQVL